MTKQFLFNQLENHHHAFAAGLAALKLLRTPEAVDLLDGATVAFGNRALHLDQVAAELRNPTDRDLVTDQFLKIQLRALVREPFEHIKTYCRETGQLGKLRAAPWFHFARIIRNCLAHDFRFTFSRGDLALLPVVWRGHEISAALQGSPLTLQFFGIADAIDLFDDMSRFANTDFV